MKNKCNPDDAAFSDAVDHYGNPTLGYGLTKREYMATKILAGICSNVVYNTMQMKELFNSQDLTLEMLAVKIADGLIRELNK